MKYRHLSGFIQQAQIGKDNPRFEVQKLWKSEIAAVSRLRFLDAARV
jgi:hypothetical protein